MATLLQGTRFLSSVRFKAIIQTLASDLEINRPLIYLDMVPIVNAFDDEILGRFTGSVLAADIIADDQEAVVQEVGRIELTTNAIPNLKHGQRLGQAKLNMMSRLENMAARAEEEDALATWEEQLAENLITGVRQRMNSLCCAMMLDAYSYDRLGITLTGATWGMPANLKVTASPSWTTANAATMTPISDLLRVDNVAMDSYGIMYDRVIMSSATLDVLTGSDQFKNRATIYMNPQFATPTAAVATEDRQNMKAILGRILNKEVIIDDGTYNERTNEGAKISRRYLPLNKVILARSQDEGDSRVWDFANGIVTESIVGRLLDSQTSIFSGGDYGPVGYYTGRADLNPPDVVAWAVARGFPRKHVPEATAVLTIS